MIQLGATAISTLKLGATQVAKAYLGATEVWSSMDADAAALIAAMTSTPDATRQAVINTAIVDLKAAGIWAKLDEFWFLAAHSEQAALLGWKRFADASKTNSPTVTTDRGIAPTTTGYLMSGLAPSACSQLSQNSASATIYIRNDPAVSNRYDIGCGDSGTNFILLRSNSGGNALGYANSTTSVAGTGIGGIGMWSINRSGASSMQLYKNGSSVNTGTGASSGVSSQQLCIGGWNNNGTVSSIAVGRQNAFVALGASLNATEHANLYSIVQAYMTAIGANV